MGPQDTRKKKMGVHGILQISMIIRCVKFKLTLLDVLI
jgi:hypothetical protein